MDFLILGVLIVGFVLISCILAIVTFKKVSILDRRFSQLKLEVGRLNDAISAGAQAQSVIVKKVEVVAPEPLAVENIPIVVAPAQSQPPPSVKPKPTRDVEKALASRWFVWIGGAAVALGGLLFIKYAHDHGLISPSLRVILGMIFAALLVAGGEFIRRARGTDVMDYVPAALSAAGLVTAFGSVYASHALYALISGGIAFAGLGCIALGAFALARLQGPLIAALGLIGAYAAPMLVTTSNPDPWAFYAYLLVILGASFFTLRAQQWWWLGYSAIAGSFAWTMLWINGNAFANSDVIPIGFFAISLALISTLTLDVKNIFSGESGNLIVPAKMSWPLRLATCGMAAASLILAAQVLASSHVFLALVFFTTGMALLTSFSWVKKAWSGAVLVAAGLTLCVLMSWQDVSVQTWAMDESGMWTSVPGIITPQLFRNWMFFAMSAFGLVGVAGYLRKTQTQPWAILTSGSVFLFLFGAWSRADFMMGEGVWASLAVVLAIILLSLAYLRRHSFDQPETEFSASVLLSGSALLFLFAFDRLFDDVWYTIAIAALAASFAGVSRAIPVRSAGVIASIAGTIATLRLFVAREFWAETTTLPWGLHWPLYGYGLTAVLLLAGAKFLNLEKYRRHVVALEGLSLGLAISMVSLELRVLISGGIVAEDISLLEMSTHILVWLGTAFGLAYRQNLVSSFVALWGSRILLGSSCAAILGFSLIALNPLVTGDPVAGGIFINSLWLAYLAPVFLLMLISRKLENLSLINMKNAIGILALTLLVVFVTLQIKRFFQGPVLIAEFISDAESYIMSAVWLLLAIVLFSAGLKFNQPAIRYAGLAVMILAVLKTFAYDLWQLGGLWQITSVMGIGLSLIGIGWLYTKYLRPAGTQTV